MQTEHILENKQGRLRVSAKRDDILHITFTAEKEFATKLSLIVTAPKGDSAPLEREDTPNAVILRTGALEAHIHPRTLAITYRRADGALLLREDPRRPRELEPVEVFRYRRGAQSKAKKQDTVDGMQVKVEGLEKVFDRTAFHTKLNFQFAKDEALFGLGSHEEGYANLRGKSRFLYQQNMKACVPFFCSTAGWGLLLDSATDMTFHDDGYGSYIWTDVDDELEYYFIAGDFSGAVKGYRYLTGKCPMMPRWMFGYAQSKERYQTADELVGIAKEYRRRGVPLDLIIQDWKTWEGELWGDKNFDVSRYPDPDATTTALHDMHVRMMISIWPNMAVGGANHTEMLEKGRLLLNDSTYNAFDSDARALYWKQANEGLFRHGVDAWWCDCTEPFEADWTNSPVKPQPEQRQRLNVGETATYLDPETMAAYSLLHSGGIYDGQRAVSDKRVVNLTRSAYAGQQRYATVTWSGDISANWETLRIQIAEGVSFTASGCPYWSTDIGGFFVRDWVQWYGDGHYNEGPADPAYRELYLRWLQYGAFLPMMRSHGTDFGREIWRFGEAGEPVYDAIAEMIGVRYRLLPYLYSLAWEVSENDGTMMRHPALDYPGDTRTHGLTDQFLLGDLMVCPVTEPGAEFRGVYLPEAERWYDFWTGEPVPSGWLDAPVTLERIPVYARGGAIIPMGPVVMHADTVIDTPLDIHIYRGRSGEFALYDDDGATYACERGEYGQRTLRWDDDAGSFTVSGEVFPGGVYQSGEFHTIIHE